MIDRDLPDNRNVIDPYKYWETEAILADLDTKRNNFSVLCSNVIGDFNLGTVVRGGNAFLAKEVLIYGKRKWDRRAAVGTHNYTHFKIYKGIEGLDDLREYIKDYHVVGIDNVPGAVCVNDYIWPSDKHVLMVFGEEGTGIGPELMALCHDIVYIRQLGSVRSLNVGTAAGISMFSYCQSVVY